MENWKRRPNIHVIRIPEDIQNNKTMTNFKYNKGNFSGNEK